MKLLTNGRALFAALLAGGLLLTAAPAKADKVAAKHPGTLHVYDAGHLFSASGADRAKSALSNALFSYGLSVTVDTYEKIPDARKGEYKDDNKAAFFRKWAEDAAKGDRAKGVYVLICRSPGYVEVIADKTTRDRGFSNENERKLRDIFLGAFKDAKAAKEAGKSDEEQVRIRDEALLGAVAYITTDLKDTSVVVPTTGKGKTTADAGSGGRSVMSWVCIGLCVLLGVWFVIGLIRMFTGGGGGYGGGGYGGGGGGFFSGLMGGMFGAMAGMWLYNNMFGSSSFGNDAYANDAGTGGAEGTAAGDGDFGGDTGAGGGYDDGGTGGGDYGGGGDFGGGGDYGGGGDFGGGGGGGDFGGDF
jgi:uncharacterized protein